MLSSLNENHIIARGQAGIRTVADLHADVHAIAQQLPMGTWNTGCVLIGSDRYCILVGLLAAWNKQQVVHFPPTGNTTVVDAIASQPNIIALLHDLDMPHGINLRTRLESTGVPPALIEPKAHTVVLHIHTSGTTGKSNEITKTAEQLFSEVDMHATHFSIGPRDTILATVPAYHLYGLLFSILLPARSGAGIIRESPLHAEATAQLAHDHGATIFVSTPAHLDGLRVLVPNRLHFKKTFSSGAALSAEVAERYRTIAGHTPHEIFGSTETGGIATRIAPETSWKPLPGVAVHANPKGLLCVQSFYAGTLFQTNDAITMQSDGTFVHHGRIDDVVKIAGKRVQLKEIIETVRRIPNVTDAAACARAVSTSHNNEILLVVASRGCTPETIRHHIKKIFEPAVIPRKICMVDSMPRSSTGKISHKVIAALCDARDRSHAPLVFTHEDLNNRLFVGSAIVPHPAWCFEGHFPSRPILPGAALLHYAVAEKSIALWPELQHTTGAARIKFTKIIQPGNAFEVRLQCNANRVVFSITGQEGPCASGTMTFAGEIP